MGHSTPWRIVGNGIEHLIISIRGLWPEISLGCRDYKRSRVKRHSDPNLFAQSIFFSGKMNDGIVCREHVNPSDDYAVVADLSRLTINDNIIEYRVNKCNSLVQKQFLSIS